MRWIAALFFLFQWSAMGLCGEVPAELQGTWEVTYVAVDTSDQPHWRYEPNDPRLLGRILIIGPDGKITLNFSGEACDKVTWVPGVKTTISDLIGKIFLRPPHNGLPIHPSLKDFNLSIKNELVRPWRARCSHAYWGSAWFATVATQELFIAYDAATVLVLKKITRAMPIRPSFSCLGKLSPTETAICGSEALAAYDRSVLLAYKRSIERNEDNETLQKEQREWLKQRNLCKTDEVCIEKEMRNRVDSLMQD